MAIYLRWRNNKIEVIDPQDGSISTISRATLKDLEKHEPSRLYWL